MGLYAVRWGCGRGVVIMAYVHGSAYCGVTGQVGRCVVACIGAGSMDGCARGNVT